MGDVSGTRNQDWFECLGWSSDDDSSESVKKISICPLTRPNAYCESMLSNTVKTTRVCIGTYTFWCSSKVLKAHCNYFERHFRTLNHFREGADLSARGFQAAYSWMRSKEDLDPSMPPEDLVALIHTAMQLEMPTLLAMLYQLLCTFHYREEVAFKVYLRALPYPQLEAVRKLMLQRIGTAFLAVIGGDWFVQMPLEDVMTMLQQDSLGVNSEVEVLVAVVRWLTANPIDIATATVPLMSCLRLTLIPLNILERFWNSVMDPWTPSEPFINMFRSNPHLGEMISCAFAVVQLQLLYRNRREFLAACRSKGFLVHKPREWIYDEDCSYHLPRPCAPYSHTICIHLLMNNAIRRAKRLSRWPRGFGDYYDLDTISEDSEDKDDEFLPVPEQLRSPGEAQHPVSEHVRMHFMQNREAIDRELEGLHMSMDELMVEADRRAEQRMTVLGMESRLNDNLWASNWPSELNSEGCSDWAMSQEDGFRKAPSEVQAAAQDLSDTYYFEHVCRLRQLVQPKTVASARDSSVVHAPPLENYVLNTDLMISRLLEQLEVLETP